MTDSPPRAAGRSADVAADCTPELRTPEHASSSVTALFGALSTEQASDLDAVHEALRQAGMTVFIHDLATDMVRFMGNKQAMMRLPPCISMEELLTWMSPQDSMELAGAIRATRSSSGRQRFLHHRGGDDGQKRWLRCDVLHSSESGAAGIIVGIIQDVTEARQAELALAESETRLRAVVEHTADAITIMDRDGHFLLVNPTAARALDGTPETLLGQRAPERLPDMGLPNTRLPNTGLPDMGRQAPAGAAVDGTASSGIDGSGTRTYETNWQVGGQLVSASVTEFPYWQRGEIQGTVCISHDVSTQKALERELRELAQELEARVAARTAELTTLTRQLRHAARHDELTGLPNRAHFMERLQNVVEQRLRDPSACFAVLFLDFDHFKLVNDSLGHAAGDDLLRQVARRLEHEAAEQRAAPGSCMMVARYGGDEFMVLMCGVEEPGEVARLCERLGARFRQPFTVCGREVQASASIGATVGARRYTRAEDALRDADIAMYRAKGRSRGTAALFEPAMRERQVQMLELQSDLGQALRRGELLVHYQPIMAVGNGSVGDGPAGDGSADGRAVRVTGVEALVRWQHPQHGLIPPADFILLAEERGLIRELDLWVLRRACTELMSLLGEQRALGVNFSARHFEQPGLPERVGRVLAETGFPPHRLIVEITEGLLLSNGELAARLLRQLQERGIQIAIDDFGTGYSALSYIQRFPLNIVKIDRAFTNDVTKDPAIVRSIVQMARSLGLRVVAEGVETPEQQRALQDLGCDYAQGYLYARPLSPEGLRAWLQERGDLSAD